MTSHQLTINYSAKSAATSAWVRLEQKRVANSDDISIDDLRTMLAMVRSGISAQAYHPYGCEAYVNGDKVYADLTVYAWPSSLDLQYAMLSDLVVLGDKRPIRMERDFDLVVGMTDTVELPFLTDRCDLAWQTPCYNAFGAEVEAPTLTVKGATLHLGKVVFGVLRVRCTAVGHAYPATFSMRKSMGSEVTNLKPSATATWLVDNEVQTDRIALELPGCLEAVMQVCDDGLTPREHAYGKLTEEKEVPAVYFSTCSGRVILIRSEKA